MWTKVFEGALFSGASAVRVAITANVFWRVTQRTKVFRDAEDTAQLLGARAYTGDTPYDGGFVTYSLAWKGRSRPRFSFDGTLP